MRTKHFTKLNIINRMKPMFWIVIIIIVVIVSAAVKFLFSARQDTTRPNPIYAHTAEEALQKGRGENRVLAILHQEEIDNGVLIFYLPNIKARQDPVRGTQLGFEFLEQTWRGWKFHYKGGTISSNVPSTIHYIYIPSELALLQPIMLGEINDRRINSLLIIDKGTDTQKEAKIIDIELDKTSKLTDRISMYGTNFRLWYVIMDDIDYNNSLIKAIDSDGNVLFEDDAVGGRDWLEKKDRNLLSL